MPQYVKTVWVNGTVPALNDSNLNKMEQGIFDAFRQDGSTTMSAQFVTIAGSAGTPAIAPTGDSNTGIFFPAADTIAFGEGGAEIMRINSSGNVGIGTLTPADKLHVEGNLYFGTSARSIYTAGAGSLTFQTNTGAMLFLRNNGSNETMRLTNAGNVGIGTTSPTNKLQIDGVTANTSCINAVANTTTGQSFGIALSAGTNSSDYALNIRNAAQTSQLFHVTGAGNVGIGTASPSSALHISSATASFSPSFRIINTGTANDQQSTMAFSTDNSTSNPFLIGKNSVANGADTFLSNQANSAMIFETNGTARMRITSAGNVGIGTTSPAVKFVVESNQASFGSSMQIINTGTSNGQRPQLAFYNANTTNPGFLIGKNNTGDGGDAFLVNEANTAMLFVTNGLTRLTIEAGGTTRPFANNTYDLGSSTYRWATIYAQNALNTSDARLKTDVAPSILGLDFINQLNPVQYRWIEGGNTVEKVQTGTETVEITPAIPAQPEVMDEEGNIIQEATQEVPAVTEEKPIYETVVTPREGVRTHFGLIAQEVKSALPDGLDFAGWCLADKDDANSTQSLGYTQLISPMIKAIQELKAEIDTLKAQLNGN